MVGFLVVEQTIGEIFGYTAHMSHVDFLLYKLIALVVIVAVVNFVYALITGRTIEQARRERRMGQRPPTDGE